MKISMKYFALFSLIAGVLFAFTPIANVTKEVKLDKSKVVWKGYKVTGSHYGTITLKSGALHFNDDQLVGGEFVIDMSTIVADDLEGSSKGKLEGHLKSDDFFGVEKFPTASLKLTKVEATGKNSYQATGDLTIKGITKPITFDLSIYGNKANATMKIDRSKYNVRYGSTSFFDDLKDKAIYDEFDLVADIEF
ncbi:YceI family protein [Membranihabitans marinus]|uniref:YceI family protein n=1 Tax=Membranihabitans marinus TaxID=1227546 RepID=UPI001F394145|nr:YceI family protein [Membranihabitans marinus]